MMSFSFPRFCLVSSLLLAAACGGTSVLEQGGVGGAGGAGSTSVTGTSASAVSGTTTASTTSSTGAGGAGGSSACEGLSESGCMAAYPSCVPVYDDACCPSCNPMGGCADCVDYFFHHCDALDTACLPEEPGTCGFSPGWACAGGVPDCGAPGGSPTPCGAYPGCVEATCSPDVNCPPDIQCRPVTGGTCQNQCDSVPPSCPEGTIAESDGFCYTGYCVPAEVCLAP